MGENKNKCDIIVQESAKLDIRRNFFTMRVAKEWNQLPEEVKNQKSVDGFKNAYDRWIQNGTKKDGDQSEN